MATKAILFSCCLFVASVSLSAGSHQSGQENQNPYYIPNSSFVNRYSNQYGRISVLPRFDQHSRLLSGLKEYRLVDVEIKPLAIILPHHTDAHYIVVVLEGKGILAIVNRNNRELYRVKCGDVVITPAGSTVYVANEDDSQNLRMAKLALPINIPGEFVDFIPSGKQNLGSYYEAFSKETLEDAFNAEYEDIQKAFLLKEQTQHQQQQRETRQKQKDNQGIIIEASKKKLRRLVQDAERCQCQTGDQSSKHGPFNLRNSPLFANENGRAYEVQPENQPQLQNSNISVGLIELSKGSLFVPHYHTEAIVLAMVIDGYGRSEIACPHLSSHSQQQQREKGSGSQEQEQEQGHQHREEEEQGQGHHQREKGSGSEEQDKKHEQQQQKEKEQGQGHHQREKGSGSEEQEKEHGQQPQQEEEEHEQQQGQEQEHESGQIQGLTANLYPNDLQVILAGHPVALRATEDLRVLLFRINVGRNDERIFLAGARNNAINQLGREAKDFTFSSSFEVDRLMEKQDELFFVKTDRESHGQQSKERESGGQQREEREKGRDFALHWVSRYFV